MAREILDECMKERMFKLIVGQREPQRRYVNSETASLIVGCVIHFKFVWSALSFTRTYALQTSNGGTLFQAASGGIHHFINDAELEPQNWNSRFPATYSSVFEKTRTWTPTI